MAPVPPRLITISTKEATMLSVLVNVLLTLGSAIMGSVLMNPFSLGLMSFQYVSLLTPRHLSLSCMLQLLHAHSILFQLQISLGE